MDRRVSPEEWRRRALEVTPGGVMSGFRASDDPLLAIARGEGAYVHPLDGPPLLDFWQGGGANLFGYTPKRIIEAVTEQAKRGFVYVAGFTPYEVLLSESVVRALPRKEKVLFCAGGGEAIANAVRVARAYTGRRLILKMEGCYHGTGDGLLVSVAPPADMIGSPYAHSAGALNAATRATLVCPYNDLDAAGAVLAAHRGQVAAVVIEPILHSCTTIEPEPGYLEGLRTLCDEAGALLIFDEVVSGRHHPGGYQCIAGVYPDLTAGGKGLSGGLPISYLRGVPHVMEMFNTSSHGSVAWAGTYNAHPLAVAAALAADELLADGEIRRHVAALGERMRAGLAENVRDFGIEDRATVTGAYSIFCLWFATGPLRNYEDVIRGNREWFLRYREEEYKRGVYERTSLDGYGRSHICAAHTLADVDTALTVSRDAMRAMLKAKRG